MTISFTLGGPIGVDATSVAIHCTIDATKPAAFHVEGGGLSPTQAKEIAVRVRAAILAAGLGRWPAGRVVIGVDAGGAKLCTPAPALDLPIALAIAGVPTDGLLVAGELGLDGTVRAVRGALPAALLARSIGLRGVLVPSGNAREVLEAIGDASSALAVHAIGRLADVAQAIVDLATQPRPLAKPRAAVDFADVRGQSAVVATVERAVKARAGILLSGPPGAGKTMIARRISGVLPPLRRDEQVEVTRVYSAVGIADGLVTQRPFRAPHYTISVAALVGGGAARRPGEVHLATRGVLFLDEISEFSRAAISALADAIRQLPVVARPLVVASASPCPCGWRGSEVRSCACSADAVGRHTDRVASACAALGVTATVVVRSVSLADLRGAPAGESSAAIAERVAAEGVDSRSVQVPTIA